MSRYGDLVDELARERDVDPYELAAAIDELEQSSNVRRRAAGAIGSIRQTTLQGPAAADVLRADGGQR